MRNEGTAVDRHDAAVPDSVIRVLIGNTVVVTLTSGDSAGSNSQRTVIDDRRLIVCYVVDRAVCTNDLDSSALLDEDGVIAGFICQCVFTEVEDDVVAGLEDHGLGHIREQLDGIAGSRSIDRRLYGLILSSVVDLCDIGAGLNTVCTSRNSCRDITVSTVLFGNRTVEGTAVDVKISTVNNFFLLSGSLSEYCDPFCVV